MLHWVQCCHAWHPMVMATCMPTAHKALNRSHYVALEMQEMWNNLEPLLLKAEVWNLQNGISLKWIQKLMLHVLSSHAQCNFSTRNNRSLSIYLSLHLQHFLLFLSPDCLTQGLPITPNFLLVTNILNVKIALNQISFFWPVPQGWENTGWQQTFDFAAEVKKSSCLSTVKI